MIINMDVKQNTRKFIKEMKQQPHSVWIAIVMHLIVVIDLLLFSYTNHRSIWIDYLSTSIMGLIYIIIAASLSPPNPECTFDFWGEYTDIESTEAQPHSQLFGKWGGVLYILYMIFPIATPGEALGMIWIDFVIIIIFGILAMGFIRFDFRSDASNVDI